MSDRLPGLVLETAVIQPIQTGVPSLNTGNLQREFDRKVVEMEAAGEFDFVPHPLDFPSMQYNLDHLVNMRKIPLDVALDIVLCLAGLDYRQAKLNIATTELPAAVEPLPTREGFRVSNTRIASQFVTINSPATSRRNAKPAELALSPGNPGRELRNSRLQPHEECPKGQQVRLAPYRFHWNVAYWLKDMAGDGSLTDYTTWESRANGLSIFQNSHHELTPQEDAFRHHANIPLWQYRTWRARLIIGFACIYEHNLRGSRLNQEGCLHPACRPYKSSPFKYSNMGISQAQMQAHGVDVKKATTLYQICVELRYIPASGQTSRPSTRGAYSINEALEKCFPSEKRVQLYQDLERWHTERGLPQQLRYVIEAA